ncbi:hypothetical protein LX36DRAFT_436918 [Colletotrichum falcatum]|nr:hypothetical protein LX36DRAFT_436918 [Colletotrichum falcatum]
MMSGKQKEGQNGGVHVVSVFYYHCRRLRLEAATFSLLARQTRQAGRPTLISSSGSCPCSRGRAGLGPSVPRCRSRLLKTCPPALISVHFGADAAMLGRDASWTTHREGCFSRHAAALCWARDEHLPTDAPWSDAFALPTLRLRSAVCGLRSAVCGPCRNVTHAWLGTLALLLYAVLRRLRAFVRPSWSSSYMVHFQKCFHASGCPRPCPLSLAHSDSGPDGPLTPPPWLPVYEYTVHI